MQIFSKLSVIAISALGLASSTLAAPVELATNSTLIARGPNDTHNGQATYYTPGLGACGKWNGAGELVAAVSASVYDALMVDKNPNHSKACGRSARVTAGGKSVNVRVVDRCGDCPQHNIDLSPTAFQQLAPLSKGRISVTWKLN
ncbi:putative effector protein [Ceratobasidium theobromae]|uniref:Putative effector protein n=1 Tax=Ceratobasidium theobromae TaxID=1582974 RepID=A0A5N5Q6A1_9AGAM|nr:putative effector protein [Ceratobasidium theobromae]